MANTSACSRLCGGAPACFAKVRDSKVTDVVLITGIVALLAIGILSSVGILPANLAYGMYAGAAVLLAAEIVKRVCQCRKGVAQNQGGNNRPPRFQLDEKKQLNEQIEKIEIANAAGGLPRRHYVYISLKGENATDLRFEILDESISSLIDAIDDKKCSYRDKENKNLPKYEFSYDSEKNGASEPIAMETLKQLLKK